MRISWRGSVAVTLIIIGVWSIASRAPLSNSFWAIPGCFGIGFGLSMIVNEAVHQIKTILIDVFRQVAKERDE